MFRDAKVGDRVWSVEFGWGTIIETDATPVYQIKVVFDKIPDYLGYQTFTKDGHRHKDACTTLFWDEVKITPPPRPKRKVKKVKEFWLNVYCQPEHGYISVSAFTFKEDADRFGDGINRLGEALFIRHEYEEEE